ncbi:MAG: hypothetical protein K2J08_11445 [Ruminococcus sp.]|nr:hypothetical protein [Ruminococcus sp.]
MKHLNNSETKKRNMGFFLMYTAVAVGIIGGAVYAVKNSAESPLVHQYFLPSHCGNTLYQVFKNTFLSLAVFIIVAFFMGISASGQPVGVAMLIYRGFGIGASVSAEYLGKGANALPSVAVLMLPECMTAVIISVLAVREIFRSANSLFVYLIQGSPHNNNENNFRLYCLKFSVLIAISAVISVITAILNYIFSGLR